MARFKSFEPQRENNYAGEQDFSPIHRSNQSAEIDESGENIVLVRSHLRKQRKPARRSRSKYVARLSTLLP